MPYRSAKQSKSQSSQYDKILKENLDAALPALIRTVLGIQIRDSEDLPPDVQHTKERKPDALKWVTDQAGFTFVLHVEFQVGDDPDMVYRMAEYAVMLSRKYRLPVRQYVLFLGNQLKRMTDRLITDDLQFRYSLINLRTIDHRLFLRSNKPEEVLLSILADFGNRPSEEVITNIVKRLDETTEQDLTFQRHTSQLRILVYLRKLGPIFDQVMDSIAHLIKKENDVLYVMGRREGKEEGLRDGKQVGKQEIIANLLKTNMFSVEQIAELADVSVDFVKAVQAGLP